MLFHRLDSAIIKEKTPSSSSFTSSTLFPLLDREREREREGEDKEEEGGKDGVFFTFLRDEEKRSTRDDGNDDDFADDVENTTDDIIIILSLIHI